MVPFSRASKNRASTRAALLMTWLLVRVLYLQCDEPAQNPSSWPIFSGLFLVLVGKLSVEPGARVGPMPLSRCQREVKRLGDFRHGQAGEKAEFDDLGLDGIVSCQTGKCLIECQ